MSRPSPSRPSADRSDPELDRGWPSWPPTPTTTPPSSRSTGTLYFEIPGLDGFVAYRRAGRLRVQFGGVVAASERSGPAAGGIPGRHQGIRAARDGGAAHPGRRRHLPPAMATGSTSWAVPTRSTCIDSPWPASTSSSCGTRSPGPAGPACCVREVGVDEQRSTELSGRLAELDRQWLGAKGSHELAFLIGERGGSADRFRRLFLAEQDGRVLGYISFSPVFGSRPGWLHDLTRRSPDAPPGVMELIVAEMIDRLRQEAGTDGPGWLHFGFTPFVGLAEQHRVPGGSTTVDAVDRPARASRREALPGRRSGRLQTQVAAAGGRTRLPRLPRSAERRRGRRLLRLTRVI